MSLFGEHELKLLNLSVIVYILLGALIFHSLGEFELASPSSSLLSTGGKSTRGPRVDSKPAEPNNGQQTPQPPPSQRQQQPQQLRTIEPSDKSSAASPSARLQLIRLNSVRRMWNITNQLNILYESNWTELVLNELLDYERLFLDSLERLAADERPDWAAGLTSGEDGGGDEDDGEDDDGAGLEDDEDKKQRKKQSADKTQSASSGASQAARRRRSEQRARLESIKKSLVHSLATITTMGSPIQPPASRFGRLLTIVYGSVGIPLLLVTVAKSGQHLARASLNALLVLRHYCLSLPLHYLCCSCNLFMCLQWLLRCCCCCYLCCLADDKQKCCDNGNAPKLKLHPAPRRGSGPRRGRHRGRIRRSSDGAAAAAGRAPNQAPTFVIGFNTELNEGPAHGGGGQGQKQGNLEQKSVRFVADSQAATTSDSDSADLAGGCERPSKPYDERATRRLFLSSFVVLAGFILAGAYYHARRQDMALVDGLFECYSMLATSKLPDSFNLDGPRRDPVQFYRSHLEDEIKTSAGAISLVAPQSQRTRRPTNKARHLGGELDLLLDSTYLLIGLNLIAACAQFARLWFDGSVRKKFQFDECPASGCPAKHSPAQIRCNGSQPAMATTSLMGSFERHGSAGQFVASSGATSNAVASCAPPSDDGGATILHGFSEKQSNLNLHHHHHHHHPAGTMAASSIDGGGQNRISLSELFVLGPEDCQQEAIESPGPIYQAQQQQQQQPSSQAPYSDGASFGSSSSQANPHSAGSLCAHHQSALGLQPLTVEAGHYVGRHLHLSSHDSRHRDSCAGGHGGSQAADMEQPKGAAGPTTSILPISTLRPSLSSIQLFDVGALHESEPVANYQQAPYNSATLTRAPSYGRRHQAAPPPPPHMNGFGGNPQNGAGHSYNDQDSSPNTFDTNSQTISSSMSGRAIVMKPAARLEAAAAGEKTVSWFPGDNSK